MLRYHTLVAGITRSGKSYFMRQLFPVLDQNGAEFAILDTKIMEWYKYKSKCKFYAQDPEDCVDLLDDVISEMMSRFSVMMARGDMEWPGRPLYVIVDEMADLIDSDMKKAFAQRLGKIARLGCAAKVILIAGAQNVTQEYIPASIKGNCPHKVCFAQDNKQKYRYLLEEYRGELEIQTGICFYKGPRYLHAVRKTNEEVIKILTEQE